MQRESANKMRIPLTICGFHSQLRIPQQLNLTIQMFYYLFVDSANTIADSANSPIFFSNFERYNELGLCLWNPKQHRRSKKSSNFADSATNLILACCGFRLQCRECTVWPRNACNKVVSKGGPLVAEGIESL